MSQKAIFISFLQVFLVFSTAWADTDTISTVADFQKADIQNGIITFSDDGEITQNHYLDPAVLTNTSTSLPKELYKHATCNFADTVVVSGGLDLSTYTDVVYLNTLQNNDLTSWRSGPNLPEPVRNHRMIKIGNYIFSIGGHTAAGASANIYRSEIDFINKTIGPWQSAGVLPQPIERFALVRCLGRVYAIGGLNSTPIDKVYMSDLDPDDNLIGWQEVTSLPSVISDLDAIVYGDHIWIVGGNNGFVDLSSIYAAQVNADGSIGSWTSKASYPLPISRHALSSTSVGILISGGASNGVNQAGVYYNIIKENGDLNQWKVEYLPDNLLDHGAVIYNNQLFLIGGRNDTTPVSVSHKIPLEEYQPWIESTAMTDIVAAPESIHGIHNYAYYTGGYDQTIENTDKIYKANFIPTGGFSTWTSGGYLPVSIKAHSVTTYGDRMYVSGGAIQDAGNTNAVYFSNQILSGNGNITSWSRTTPLPVTMTAHKSIVNNSYIYIIEKNKVYYNVVNGDGSVGSSWMQTAELPETVADINPVARDNKIYSFLNTTPLRISYAQTNPNGTLNSWIESTSAPSGFGIEGACCVSSDGKYIILVANVGYVARGLIDIPSGAITQWERMDDGNEHGGFGSPNINILEYNNIYHIYGSTIPSLYYFPIEYKTQSNFIAQYSDNKLYRTIDWLSTYPGLIIRYRLFDQNWTSWSETKTSDVSLSVNQEGGAIQFGCDIVGFKKNNGEIKQVSLVYDNIPPTPAPTPTLEGFLGKIISEKYAYVFPNPSRGSKVNFRIFAITQAKATIKVFTTSNKLVFSKDVYLNVGYNDLLWNCANIANGIYLYKINAIDLITGKEESVLKKLAVIK